MMIIGYASGQEVRSFASNLALEPMLIWDQKPGIEQATGAATVVVAIRAATRKHSKVEDICH